MGQQVNPNLIRLNIIHDWNSTWYADSKRFADILHADLEARKYLFKRLAHASVSRIQIERLQVERSDRSVLITIYSARPGAIIGKSGREIEELKRVVASIMGVSVHINIEEIRKPELEARLVAESIAQQLERRVMFRRAMKRAVSSAMRAGAEGIKVRVAGRLNGAEIARAERYREGRVPLHTFRADIDYATAEALTTYGIIGVKVWIFKGEVVGSEQQRQIKSKNRRTQTQSEPSSVKEVEKA